MIIFKKKKQMLIIENASKIILQKLFRYNDNNICFSPAGLKNVIAMILPAITGNTKKEVINVFNNQYKEINNVPRNKNDVKVISYNYSVYNDCSKSCKIKDKYKDFIKSYNGGSDIFLFSKNKDKNKLANRIQEKIKKMTNGKLTQIVEANEYNDSFAIEYTNVIYFLAKWSNIKAFDIEEHKFKNYDKTKTATDFMVFHENSAKYIENNDFVGCKMYYNHKKDRYSFYALLPRKEKFNIEKLNFDSLCEINETYKLNAKLPKFKIEQEQDYIDIFKKIGIKVLFDKEKADFRDGFHITPGDNINIYVSKFKQKIFLDVNETGSEAAAVTSVKAEMVYGAALCIMFDKRVINLVFDRPFIYCIFDELKKETLFMGCVRDLKS